jgi:hypothetical protein
MWTEKSKLGQMQTPCPNRNRNHQKTRAYLREWDSEKKNVLPTENAFSKTESHAEIIYKLLF